MYRHLGSSFSLKKFNQMRCREIFYNLGKKASQESKKVYSYQFLLNGQFVPKSHHTQYKLYIKHDKKPITI